MARNRNNWPSYPVSTKGEALYSFVRNNLNADGSLLSDSVWLSQFDRHDLWCDYIETFMALNLSGRFISSGRCLLEAHSNSTVFRTEYKSTLCEHLVLNKHDREALLRLATNALSASMEKISAGTRKAITVWAKTSHPDCYLCGRQLDFTTSDRKASFTIDHVWPRDFGGDSCAENLLPACKECNSNHKKNYPSWAMLNVQSLLLGFEPSEGSLSRISGSSRFAIHHYAVQRVATQRNMSLKDSYIFAGPSDAVRVVDRLEFGHFFNLANLTVEN